MSAPAGHGRGRYGESRRQQPQREVEGDAPAKPDVDPEQRAREICLARLTRSARTRAQLADALREKGIPDDVSDRVLGRFTEVGLIDDVAFAEMFVRSRHQERGLARRALGHELRRRGVGQDVIDDALDAVDDDRESATARRLVDARLRSMAALDPRARARRLVGMLARKGYPAGVAFAVVRDALADDAARRAADEAGDGDGDGDGDARARGALLAARLDDELAAAMDGMDAADGTG